MKATLRFDLPEEEYEHQAALDGVSSKMIISEIWEKVFRPNRKGPYGNAILDTEEANDVIEELIKIYNELMVDYRE